MDISYRALVKLKWEGAILAKKELSSEQKRLDIDLWIIVSVSLLVLGAYIAFQNPITTFTLNREQNILLRVLLAAVFQFGLAGLGISIVSIVRNECFLAYGLRKKGAITSIVLSILCFIPYTILTFATGQFAGYLPFQSVWTTKDVLANGFPINAIGILITAIAWGFFEGFNYVVISEKINKRYPSKNKWLNWGAIICAVLCILIHGAVGVTMESILQMLTIIIIIYGMLMTKELTGNAWGCIFIFVFLWNAF